MKRIFAIVFFSAGIIQTNFAQVGIGTANPDSSSILEIQFTNRGVLFPKVALQGANIVAPLTNPAKGLIVWNGPREVQGFTTTIAIVLRPIGPK